MIKSLTPPALKPFNIFHPHHFHQMVCVIQNDGGSDTYTPWFVSCPETGLTEELINTFMIKVLGVRNDLSQMKTGFYWLEDNSAAVSCMLPEAGVVYSNKDPVLLQYRQFKPNEFAYSQYATMDESEIQHHALKMMESMTSIAPEVIGAHIDEVYGDVHTPVRDLWSYARDDLFYSWETEQVSASDEQNAKADKVDELLMSYYRRIAAEAQASSPVAAQPVV